MVYQTRIKPEKGNLRYISLFLLLIFFFLFVFVVKCTLILCLFWVFEVQCTFITGFVHSELLGVFSVCTLFSPSCSQIDRLESLVVVFYVRVFVSY